ncbi:SPJ_0845 family protein [Latilactobacillus fragifolii]|uniref:SPJ_0845 family protein n=1 Tax=Latilactobacillus fragifolii TaxID=2814244 RepID=UPI0015637D48|nr:SPJ_0845 family protein [Latilactobacillus fragifolii]
MGLKVTNRTDLTGLFDKFASLPEERQKVETQVEKTADKLKKEAAKQKEKK